MTEINESKAWFESEWVRQLFIDEPAIVSMAQRSFEHRGAFGYDYCVCVLVDGKIMHRWYKQSGMNPVRIKATIEELRQGVPGRWMDEVPQPSAVSNVVNRHRLGMDEVVYETREQILEEHGEFMRAVFVTLRNISHIGKRRNIVASPNTFMFVRKNTEAVSGVTWMAHPSLSTLSARLISRGQRHRWERYDGAGSKDALDCSHIFTAEDVFTYFRAKAGGEPHVVSAPAEPVPVAPPSCTRCGISLVTNAQFGTGKEKLCGECELELDSLPGYGVSAQARKVYLQPVAPPSKFDPRPGIDDQGLGFYSPAWED